MVFGGTRRRGLNNTPMSEDGSLCLPVRTPNSLSEHPRDEQPIRNVPEHDENVERALVATQFYGHSLKKDINGRK